ncbi:MAG: hypothetical protein Q4E24_10860 [bacterium]|nr:hypothetical protein [bacterium]
MSDLDEFEKLKEENIQLKKDNDTMMQIITQMKTTLNRLLEHYVLEQTSSK